MAKNGVSDNKMPLFVWAQMVREASLAVQPAYYYGLLTDRQWKERTYAINSSITLRNGRNIVERVSNDDSVILSVSQMAAWYAANETDIRRFFTTHNDIFEVNI